MARDEWNFSTLRQLMDERDIRYQQRYDAQQKALDAALLSSKEAVQAALLAAKEAVTKAELSADKRFELLNELRSGVATTEQLEALEKLVADLSKRQDLREGRSGGMSSFYGWLIGVAGLIVSVVIMANVLSR